MKDIDVSYLIKIHLLVESHEEPHPTSRSGKPPPVSYSTVSMANCQCVSFAINKKFCPDARKVFEETEPVPSPSPCTPPVDVYRCKPVGKDNMKQVVQVCLPTKAKWYDWEDCNGCVVSCWP